MGGYCQPAMPVAVNLGPQPCFKCEGKGFCHDSTMDHDKPPNERCFFCKECSGCGGSGAIRGGTMTGVGMGAGMTPMGVDLGPQRCFKCEGHGFVHDSSMAHDKAPDEKCFFCKDCNSCGGSGAIKGGAVQAVGGAIVNTGPQRCFKCEGKGFCHDSTMAHDKPPHEKCFFCKDCSGCGGSGAINGAMQPGYAQPGYAQPGYAQPGYAQSGYPQQLPTGEVIDPCKNCCSIM